MKAEPRGIVTDAWEYEGITIKLRVIAMDAAAMLRPNITGIVYEPRLSATDSAPSPAK
ncbi:MAG: hypothetical protein WDN28_15375 [Chthoniobacter sp.]